MRDDTRQRILALSEIPAERWARRAGDGGETRCGDLGVACAVPILCDTCSTSPDAPRGDDTLRCGCGTLTSAPSPWREVLTPREWQVMELLAAGRTMHEIAKQLTADRAKLRGDRPQLTVKTVDTHRGHILKKLGLRNNTALAHWALRHGFVPITVEDGPA